MKRNRLTLMATITLVLLCGCGSKTDVTVTPQNSPAETVITSTESTIEQSPAVATTVEGYDHSLVCDRWADSGSFKIYISDEECYEFYFDYSVPQIVDDTADAKEINYYIACLYEDMHDTMQKAARDGWMTAEDFDRTGWFQTNYDCYWNDSIASIVIYSTGYYESDTQTNVYNYDFATGTWLSNEDLLTLKGLTVEKFVEDLRRSAAYLQDLEMQPFFESEMPLVEDNFWYSDVVDQDVQHMYGDYLQARAKTLHCDNIDEYVPIYLDEQGQLQAVTHLYNMSMYGDVTTVLSPREWVDNNIRVYCGDLLTVESKDDGIYLTIYRDDWSDEVHDEFPTFEFAKEYKINGLFKNYVDARISWVGNGRQPYILLLSDDGMISYVDIWEGIASEYFCAVEPLWGLQDLKSFDDDSEYRIVGVNSLGQTIDIEDALYMMLNCRYIDFEKNILNFRNVTRYSAMVQREEAGQNVEYEELIGFNDDEYQLFIRESYRTDTYEGGAQLGYITFSGMTDQGMVFHFYLVGEDGELRGSMAIDVYSLWDESIYDFIDRAEVTWLGGLDIFESKGYRVMLNGSVG